MSTYFWDETLPQKIKAEEIPLLFFDDRFRIDHSTYL